MKKIIRTTVIITALTLFTSIISFAALSENIAPDKAPAAGVMAAAGESPKSSQAGGSVATADKLENAIILYVGSPVAFVNGKETRIDPDNIEVAPSIIDNVEMVPVRFIAESLGGIVRWDGKSRTASIILNGKSYSFTQDSDMMATGSGAHLLGAAVRSNGGRIFVPLDKFVEIIGKKAFYDRGLIIISDMKNVIDRIKDKELISEWISKLSYLPAVGSYDKLAGLLEKSLGSSAGYIYGGLNKSVSIDTAGVANENVLNGAAAFDENNSADSAKEKSSAATASDGGTGVREHSATNIQVQGVDEGDIVKTDGRYIYQVNKERVVITNADSPENMKVLSMIDFAGENIIPGELYLDDSKLTVIGTSRAYFPIYKNRDGIQTEIYPSRRFLQSSVKVLIYDIKDRSKVKLLREVEIEGRYLASRKIGSSLYIVANDELEYYRIQNDEANITPSYKDSIGKDGYVTIGYDSIRYFPGAVHANYMITAGIDIDGNEPANVSAYLGAGQNIYVSGENLYIALTGHDGNLNGENTLVYKFALKDAKLTYLCKGEVPGSVLNQFSMDERNGTFRIATTRGNVRAAGENISKNALYILDSMLTVTGRLEDMAPGEKIYSVRFMGDRAYVVTFKTVDPLFVIDLKNPAKPAILGALKIPGYSDYLHPYDENHIIGFGKDTVEIKGQAYYLGMKIALFDVTDVGKPVQKFTETIGDRGTDSELLRNHKSLLFSKEKNLLAFPVTLMEVHDNVKSKPEGLQYGEFTFQGAYVYSLDLKNGFKLKGRITHLSDEDYLKAGNNWYDSDKNIRRIIYIGDDFFTLSNSMIKANAIQNLKELGSVKIP